MNKKIIVIGAGIGGLAAAVRLLAQGFEVTVLEKNAQIGGKVGSMSREGFRFDTGATLMMLPQDYLAVFGDAGLKAEDYIQIEQLATHYQVFSGKGHCRTYSGDLDQMLADLAQRSPKLSHRYLDFLADTYGKYLFMEKYLVHAEGQRNDWLNSSDRRGIWQRRSSSSAGHLLRRYFHDHDFLEFLYFQSMYLGSSPEQGSNTLALTPAVTQMYGLWYIKGGMMAYAEALAQAVRDLGGVILMETPAEEIIVAGQCVIGVKTTQSVLLADRVLCDADYSYCLEKLLPKLVESRHEADMEDLSYSCGTFCVYLALNQTYPQLAVHNMLVGSHFKKNMQAPFRGKLPRRPLLYIYCPSSIDETAAPVGQECISVVWRVPNMLTSSRSWNDKLKKKLLKKTLALLENEVGLTDLAEHLIFAECSTPDDLQERLHSYGGASFGLSPEQGQDEMRPSCRSERVTGLYFVGDSIQPGTGVSMVLRGSKTVADAIVKTQ